MFAQFQLGLLQSRVAIGTGLHEQRAHIAVHAHASLTGLVGRERINGHVRVKTAHPQRR